MWRFGLVLLIVLATGENGFFCVKCVLSVLIILVARHIMFSHININHLSCCSGYSVSAVKPGLGGIHAGFVATVDLLGGTVERVSYLHGVLDWEVYCTSWVVIG